MRFEAGQNLKDYRLLALLAALPLGVLLWLYIRFCRLTSRVTISDNLKNIRPHSILFYVHHDYYTSLLVTAELARAFPQGTVFLGYHGFYSYVPWIWFMPSHCLVCRYFPHAAIKPFTFILSFVRQYPERLYLQYTDSGGPYGRVRESLPKLGKELERPIVAARILASRSVEVLGHELPLPFSKIAWLVSHPLQVEQLQALSIDEARNALQEQLDQLTK